MPNTAEASDVLLLLQEHRSISAVAKILKITPSALFQRLHSKKMAPKWEALRDSWRRDFAKKRQKRTADRARAYKAHNRMIASASRVSADTALDLEGSKNDPPVASDAPAGGLASEEMENFFFE